MVSVSRRTEHSALRSLLDRLIITFTLPSVQFCPSSISSSPIVLQFTGNDWLRGSLLMTGLSRQAAHVLLEVLSGH